MACRLPGHSNSPQAFWDMLLANRVADNQPPASRFSLDGHFDGSRKPHTMATPGGMWLEDVDTELWDAPFFNVPRSDAAILDPQQRQLLEVVYECLENAGATLDSVRGSRTGCFVAAMCGDYELMQARDPDERAENTVIGVARSILSNRISHFLDIRGPSMTVDTACSGSLTAIDAACRYLEANQCDGMLVAGVNLYLEPSHNEEGGLMRNAASASGRCHTFDAKADGYCRAEAVNAVFLKRLDDAVRDRDPIRAVIRGTACNNDGRTPTGITSPSAEAQTAAIRAAYANAGIADLDQTAFLECHGTGTQAGDPIEVQGAAAAFATPARKAGRRDPLLIGSCKSNIGHSEAGAGISGLIKAVLAIERGVIPGNPTYVTPNPKIDFKASCVEVVGRNLQWPKSAMLRASVNSFGFGGSNAHAVVESPSYLLGADARDKQHHVLSHQRETSGLLCGSNGMLDMDLDDTTQQRPQLLVLSANNQDSLQRNIDVLEKHLLNPAIEVRLDDLAYTLSERRTHHFNRAFTVSRATDQIEWNAFSFDKTRAAGRRVAMIFTGQGAQWSQMGRELLETYPLARRTVEALDGVLQTLPEPLRPGWRLVDELSRPRKADVIRKPEFSQPLVTALQLALLAVLADWNVKPAAVVGHSSGEIAAAVAAGYMSSADAIRTAYFRGYGSKQTLDASQQEQAAPSSLGMLAVGVGPDVAQSYLDKVNGPSSDMNNVHIACYNSPSSLTISGPVSALAVLEAKLKDDGHFARLLQVDLAYHSPYMASVASYYKKTLEEFCDFGQQGSRSGQESSAVWFSSVTGQRVDSGSAVDAEYWKSNMVMPVQFNQALSSMILDGAEAANEADLMLIEIGPSNALAGPVSQVIKHVDKAGNQGLATKVKYCSALKRGANSVYPLLAVAGQLFAVGVPIPLAKVNGYDLAITDDTSIVKIAGTMTTAPRVVVDLPNYQWDHSTRYWHEGPASRDWRHRPFVTHHLLGAKVLGTPWSSPTFSKVLHLADVAWLRDHKIGEQVVMPGAAYVAMAVEAVYQTASMTEWKTGGQEPPSTYQFQLQDVKILRALVLGAQDCRLVTTLSRERTSMGRWFTFQIFSVPNLEDANSKIEHCTGLIRVVDLDAEGASSTWRQLPAASPDQIRPLHDADPGAAWYRAFRDVGYNFGPHFQRLLQVECTPGLQDTRNLLSMDPPVVSEQGSDGGTEARLLQPWYETRGTLHPVAFDSVTQAFIPALWKGDRAAVGVVTVPPLIESITMTVRPRTQPAAGNHAVVASSVRPTGARRPGVPEDSVGSCDVYDAVDGSHLLQIRGFHWNRVDAQEDLAMSHVYHGLVWKPDVSMLSARGLESMTPRSRCNDKVQLVLDLICHKLPHPNVLEIGPNEQRGGVVGDRDRNSSVSLHWLPSTDADDELNRSRADACASYHFVSAEPQTLLAIQDRYSLLPNASFSLADITMAASVLPSDSEYDLAIVNVNKEHLAAEAGLGSMLKTVHDGMRDKSTGYTVVVLTSTNPQSDVDLVHKVARTAGFEVSLEFSDGMDAMLLLSTHPASLAGQPSLTKDSDQDAERSLTVFHFATDYQPKSCALREKLGAAGWNVSLSHVGDSESGQVQPGSIVLVCDELYGAVMSKITQSQWDALQMLISKECRILWLTTGAVGSNNSDGNEQIPNQMHPERAAINGLMRSVRREEPHLRLITLDLSPSSMADGVGDASSIQLCLQQLLSPGRSNRTAESEFVERQGILHISRIVPDAALNRAKLERADVYKRDLFDLRTTDPSVCVQLRAERLGNIDSLCFAETALPSDLPPNHVEVEVHASGLNYKDVAVTMGLVPADEYRLGEEAAGVVVRVAPDVTTLKPGQRVVVFSRASLANRVRASTERVHAIPDAMSFEEAATLCVVYITAMHALFNLGGLRSGMRVLVHSATGGVGNAAIQLCRSVGDVEIFATVGSDAKKQFLVDELHMPADHVFSSRTPEFVQGIRRLTDGAGVDLVLNSLTGPLLESSWHLLASNGTFVEIGKKDMLARQALPMEPFTRNVSYRALDTSPRFFPDSTIKVVMADLFRLLEKGAIKPIFPRQTFSYSRVADAFRLLRQGTHMGKLVVSREHVPRGDMVEEQKEGETKGTRDAGTVVSIRQSPHIPSQLRSDVCHLIVGGLGGLGGSLAVYLAKEMGAKNIASLSRSANVPDKVRQTLASLGCHLDVLQADVTLLEDVKAAFCKTKMPIGGIVHGAMVLRDRPFATMTMTEYHDATGCKIAGALNLHQAALDLDLNLDYFSLLSSISSIVGGKGQANYAAGNAVLDALAAHRRAMGLPACAVDLGAVEDVGYIASQQQQAAAATQPGRDGAAAANHDYLAKVTAGGTLTPINERLLRKIIQLCLLQQQRQLKGASAGAYQMITGLTVPQPEQSDLAGDARFAALFNVPGSKAGGEGPSGGAGRGAAGASGGAGRDAESKDLRELQLMLWSCKAVQPAAVRAGLVRVVGAYFAKTLRLEVEQVDVERPLSGFGIDSMAAVEIRNWVRAELGVVLATFEIINASSIVGFCDVVISKLNRV
ncbi:Type I Iterative PKS [Pyricularia oryzae]|uniref:Type I Iterative PKS n=1 Tax=Pyricularia grisea TaxID=148305 RepID=A0ABQ8NY64_PYRGI|nr:Type I Iterative PKS [Pyricularia grisea]KAI6472342.1 Type I Iterative PKS [Pyricularia oryzae]KAI6513039.1 Type I Iterative PKS [Pyricularia oryzae]KAI6533756.1 Type I Iterative PKS [Pyricularia oryzae]